MRVLLDADAVSRGLRRVAGEILEHHRTGERLVLIGVRRGGVPLAEALARWLKELDGHEVLVGSVDITLYRDDAATALPSPRIGPSKIPCALDGLRVVLVDDVLQTGRRDICRGQTSPSPSPLLREMPPPVGIRCARTGRERGIVRRAL